MRKKTKLLTRLKRARKAAAATAPRHAGPGRPRMADGCRELLQFRVPPSLFQAIARLAASTGQSVAAWCRVALERAAGLIPVASEKKG